MVRVAQVLGVRVSRRRENDRDGEFVCWSAEQQTYRNRASEKSYATCAKRAEGEFILSAADECRKQVCQEESAENAAHYMVKEVKEVSQVGENLSMPCS